jgi:hypothetical protein
VAKRIEDARKLIETRLAEMDDERVRLERALVGLGEATPRKRRQGRPPKTASLSTTSPKRKRAQRKTKGAGRAAPGQRRKELLATIAASPGARPSALAKSIGIQPSQVHAMIAKARAEKLIVKDGKGYSLTK